MRNPQLLPLVAHELDLGNLDAGVEAVWGLRATQTVNPEPEVPDIVPAGRRITIAPEIGKGYAEQAPAGGFSIFHGRPGYQRSIPMAGIELEAVGEIIILSLGIGPAQAVQVFRVGVAPLLDPAVAFGTVDVVVAIATIGGITGLGIEKVIAVGIVGIGPRHPRTVVDTFLAFINRYGNLFRVFVNLPVTVVVGPSALIIINAAVAIIVPQQTAPHAIFVGVGAAIQTHVFLRLQQAVPFTKAGDRPVLGVDQSIGVEVLTDTAYIDMNSPLGSLDPDLKKLTQGLIVVAGHKGIGDTAPQIFCNSAGGSAFK